MERMRVAFFGGTFDPIHRGHLRLATAAAEAFALDRVLFAPVGNQPLKRDAAIASYADRVAMAALALDSPGSEDATPSGEQGRPAARFSVSTLDAPRADGSANYTVDALAALAVELPSAQIFTLAGADSFLDLRRWRSSDRLLELAEWIVASRPEFPLTDDRLAPLALTGAQRARVHLLTTVHEAVSATELRRRLRDGELCTGLLSPAVSAYIEAHRLYR